MTNSGTGHGLGTTWWVSPLKKGMDPYNRHQNLLWMADWLLLQASKGWVSPERGGRELVPIRAFGPSVLSLTGLLRNLNCSREKIITLLVPARGRHLVTTRVQGFRIERENW